MTSQAKSSTNKKLSFFEKQKSVIVPVLFLMALIAGTAYGLLLHKYELFPYKNLKATYHSLSNKKACGPWSIGIYEGSSPFNLSSPADVSNPVLTGKNCGDAVFVADPFMIRKNGKFFMFFERVSRANNQGDIAYAKSADGREWKYKKVVIDEKFHLSYPNVFEWQGAYYMILESHQDLSVRLYKAESFPGNWKYVKNLLSGYSFVDPSIFRYNNKWWMFVTTPASNILNLYYSNNLQGEWKTHPMNPVIKFNNHIARPGGRVIIYNGKPYRFAQDDAPYYGIQIFAFKITELTEKTYAEKIVSENPLLTKTGKGWNSTGMHHIDLHKVGNKWIAAVDGRNCKFD